MLSSNPLIFLTHPSFDGPLILNVSREGKCECIELTDAQVHRMNAATAAYLMIKAQKRELS